MKRKMYSNDFNVSLMQEFISSGIGISKFAATKDIQLSTGYTIIGNTEHQSLIKH